MQMCIWTTKIHTNLPVTGHNRHRPGEANDTADNSKQHWSKDIKLSVIGSSPQ